MSEFEIIFGKTKFLVEYCGSIGKAASVCDLKYGTIRNILNRKTKYPHKNTAIKINKSYDERKSYIEKSNKNKFEETVSQTKFFGDLENEDGLHELVIAASAAKQPKEIKIIVISY